MTDLRPIPTQKDLSYLRAHPDAADKFDKQFGDGEAARYLAANQLNTSTVAAPVPTEKDIAFLRANPNRAHKFDAHFGEGASSSFLEMTPEVTPEVPSDEPPTISLEAAQEAKQNAGGLIRQLGDGAAHGVQEAVNETLDTIEAWDQATSAKLDEWGIPSRLQVTNGDGP